MSEIKEKITFSISAVLYFLVNLRVGQDLLITVTETGKQILDTGWYVVGITCIIVALMQYMAGGLPMPWERRFRLFFAVGIMVGLFNGIYEYAGQGTIPQ
ncbi:hypothetical protein [Desulfosediminicola flagellatus]|uniref:hypothetical protein n=1 Tax=Desulfosediminicola flagellatus TaxID=2569541 RepID=UPI0010AD83DE|nr:hypothetical protein [Desulfosediminicola flagellatus]